ncbi:MULTISPECIES: Zn-ribbon domain-containing OB-fold protein [unclassified Cupriavidus]|uniref:Zn-ribbon domain-containing OB-fold protein n=1 Tax=Cupriavidus sp. H19C3 TaxID=3241603 RepID=UPI003BF7ADAA
MATSDSRDDTQPAGPEQTYFRYLQAGEWRVPKCRDCGAMVFYPRVNCLACGAGSFDWVAPGGTGTIYSTTVMRRPAEAGGDRNLCLVDLDDGFRMMSQVEAADPAAPRIGDRVRATLRQQGDSHLVVFVPEVRA